MEFGGIWGSIFEWVEIEQRFNQNMVIHKKTSKESVNDNESKLINTLNLYMFKIKMTSKKRKNN